MGVFCVKKIISLLLCFLLIVSAAVPAAAFPYTSPSREVPVIMLGGDGEPLYDKDGNKVFEATNLTAVFDNVGEGSLYESVANVLQPMLLEGVLFNRWDRYYESLEAEIGELTASFRLDENGNAVNGTSISPSRFQQDEINMHQDKKGEKGYYAFYDYTFWYDWRLDPLELADQLAEYIDAVLAATGAQKVALIARCVGSSVTMAYLAKYGTEKLYGFGIDGTCTNGGEFLSDAISGKFKLDGNAICRFLTDYDAYGVFNTSEFVRASVDLLTKSGVLDTFTAAARATIYKKIEQGATSALALSTLFTMPCYWAFVTAEDYETALRYVFGEPGSAKRIKYAGLIEKLDNYHQTVRLHLEELMRSLPENGVNACVISKYGGQIVPICESCDAVADQYASVARSSFGATTSTIYDTLSDEYIAARVAEGKGQYISPDKQIDASTCWLPDATWFVKGARHGNWLDEENRILYEVTTAPRQLTPADLPYSQFVVYDGETKTVSPMTEENCHTENWTADAETDHPTRLLQKFRAFRESFVRWFRLLMAMLKSRMTKTE